VDDVSDIVLVENASSAVNSILRSLPLHKGDMILYYSTACEEGGEGRRRKEGEGGGRIGGGGGGGGGRIRY